jgi:membrane protease YdiL (CAAX protease family)
MPYDADAGWPSFLGWCFLVWLLVLLPWLAVNSARHLRRVKADPGSTPLPPRTRIFAGTLIMLGILLFLSWLTARQAGFDLFALPVFGAREAAVGAATFLVYLLLRQVSRALRTPEERRKMPVYALLPRTAPEWNMYVATSIAAGVAEEAAYRGVAMLLLTPLLGSAWPAALVSATAFALGHILQQWKSVVVIFAMALAMHALVALTGTLVIGMVVHAAYDLFAGFYGSREALRFDREGPAPTSPPAG